MCIVSVVVLPRCAWGLSAVHIIKARIDEAYANDTWLHMLRRISVSFWFWLFMLPMLLRAAGTVLL